ncbi:MAG: hypothetical protein IJ724_08150, partial [Muribaculaceae bacterium]|nr:hypothetical protein [Muribaculaceae bacterium]
MFMNCTSLTELDLSNFSTPVGKSFNDMFNGCENLVMLDLSNM